MRNRSVSNPSVQAETVISSDLFLAFSNDPSARQRLLDGVDDIDMTLRSETEIARFETTRPAWMPRILPSSGEPLPDDIRKGIVAGDTKLLEATLSDQRCMRRPSGGRGAACGVDLRGFEPLTSSMRTRRATNCATGPDNSTTLSRSPGATRLGRAPGRAARSRSIAPLCTTRRHHARIAATQARVRETPAIAARAPCRAPAAQPGTAEARSRY